MIFYKTTVTRVAFMTGKSILFRGLLALPILCGSLAAAVKAAEIQLRAECRSDGGLILLGDLAEVYSQDAGEIKKLSAIDVVPAPPGGERRYLRTREIQDILAARGVNLRQLRFSGASQVTIIGTLETMPSRKEQAGRKAPAPAISPRQASDLVRKALLTYLQQQSGSKMDWEIKFELTPDQVQALSPIQALTPSQSPSSATREVTVEGGTEPWTGPQQFTLSLPDADKPVAVRAEITLPPAVVVASRSLPRGSLIHAEDVRLQPGIAVQGSARVFQSLDEVIGKEVVRSIADGQILDDQWVRRPLLVHKGEIVTVYARSSGIQIRTTARSRDEGSRGELVTVETLADRKAFFARVTGPQEVDVYAHAGTVAADAPERSPLAQKPLPEAAAAADPAAPLPTASLAGPRASAGAAGGVQQAAAVGTAVSSTVPGGEPGTVLHQAALKGRNVRDKAPVKQSIVPPRRADADSKTESKGDGGK
jgi:flagella basal body P-ring formation protein FlgA